MKKETKRKGKNPFSDLGKDERTKKQRIGPMMHQGKRMSGHDLLKKAMGKMIA